jgi:peptidoglycan/LPS O-acetylase OafA/YrhL
LTVFLFTKYFSNPIKWLIIFSLTGIIISSLLLYYYSKENYSRAFMGTDSKIFEPLTGCLLALLLHNYENIKIFFKQKSNIISYFSLIILLLSINTFWTRAGMNGSVSSNGYYSFGALLTTLSTFCLIGSLRDFNKNRIGAFLGNRVFSFIGRISYSIYLWHWPIHIWT